jgi:hypothetical protein
MEGLGQKTSELLVHELTPVVGEFIACRLGTQESIGREPADVAV